MPDPIAWLNGRLVDIGTPQVSLTDRGLLYGDGLFETLRIYQGKPFRLAAHRSRLEAAAQLLRISLPAEIDELADMIQAVSRANDRRDGAVRITLTRGSGESGLDPASDASPTLQITSAPLRDGLDRPLHLVTVSIRRDGGSPLSRIKSLNYLPNILARFEVKEQQADEGLMLNTEGHIAEGTVSNIFWVKNDVLFTSSLDCGILPGIAREVVLQSAEDHGVKVLEGEFPPSELEEADDIFMTNSLMEIAPVVKFNDRLLSGATSSIIMQLQAAYQQAIHEELNA